MKRNRSFFIVMFAILILNSNLKGQDYGVLTLNTLGFNNKQAYFSKPIISASGNYLLFLETDKLNIQNAQQLSIAEFINNDWVVKYPNIKKSEKFSYLPIGAGNKKDEFFLLAIPKIPGRGEYSIEVISILNDQWVISRTATAPEFFPERSGFDAFLSSEENVMLFSFYGDNSSGAEDLYVVEKQKDGSWGSVMNMGEIVNSASSEVSPFYDEKSKTLVFSSNRNLNGKFDLYYSKRVDNSWNNWSEIKRFGNEINTAKDESGFFYLDDLAFFVSNQNKETSNIVEISGLSLFEIRDSATVKEIGRMKAHYNMKIDSLQTIISNLKANQSYKSDCGIYNSNNQQNKILYSVSILFDVNSSVLSAEAKSVLDEVIAKNKNEKLFIRMIGFCDPTGSTDYNKSLSEKRVSIVKSYFISNGLNNEQLETMAIGEIGAGTSIETSPKGRSYARRVELIIEIQD